MDLAAWTNQTIPGRFAETVARHPERTALEADGATLSYAELDRQSSRLAAAMASLGAGPGTRLALLLPEGVPLALGWLAALKTGAVCLPLPAGQPAHRLRLILADGDPILLVTDLPRADEARRTVPAGTRVAEIESLPSGDNPDLPTPRIDPGAPAYLLYTSGTTGRPRGVIQTHRNLLRNVFNLTRGEMAVDSRDRFSALTSLAMGQGVATLFTALLNGATLLPFPLLQQGFDRLAEWLRDRRVSIYTSSVSVFRQFASSLPDASPFPDLRFVRLGAEELTSSEVDLFRRKFPSPCGLLNHLGCTETMNYAGWRLDPDTPFPDGRIPVGRAALGMTVLVADPDGEECAPGETGELRVRSRYLSPGYWGDAAGTAARFRELGDGVREFRTGDLGCLLADGTLLFRGRADHQVKVRGHRVELSEIEAACRSHPAVTAAAVSEAGDRPGELTAYLATRLDESAIRHHLASRLPAPLIPARLVLLDHLPLTPSGKVDRPALAAPGEPPGRTVTPDEPAPRDAWEEALAPIWSRVLGREGFGPHDDFFALGGDSLKALTLFAEIRSTLGWEPTPADVAGGFTLAILARRFREARTAATGADPPRPPAYLIPLSQTGRGRPVFFLPGGWGGDNEIVPFAQLAARLADTGPSWAVRSRALETGWPLEATLEDHARAIFAELAAIPGSDRPILIGECVAAPLALILGRLAEDSGGSPGTIILLDPWTPPSARRLAAWWSRLPFALGRRVRPAAPSDAPLPPAIQQYYRQLKEARPAPVHASLQLILSANARPPVPMARYWSRFTRTALHSHSVRGTHETYIRGEAEDTIGVLRSLLDP